MKYLDIHSHILPAVDDGAKDIEASVALLEIFKQQGITNVIATPHFYPNADNVEEYVVLVQDAYSQLKNEIADKDLPNVHLGCELRYFNGIGKSKAIKQFTIRGTNYLLLELPYGAPITTTVLQDIIDIRENQGLVPILAHIERYNRVPGYKKLLKLIAERYALAHINASGVMAKESARLCEGLIKKGYVSYLASDAHSPDNRPPQIQQALAKITDRLGCSAANRLIIKSTRLLEEIEAANEERES